MHRKLCVSVGPMCTFYIYELSRCSEWLVAQWFSLFIHFFFFCISFCSFYRWSYYLLSERYSGPDSNMLNKMSQTNEQWTALLRWALALTLLHSLHKTWDSNVLFFFRFYFFIIVIIVFRWVFFFGCCCGRCCKFV